MFHDSRLGSASVVARLPARFCTRYAGLLVLLALLPAALVSLPAFGEEPGKARLGDASRSLAELVVELGHETWSRREAAQHNLLKRSDQAITHLRDALESDNLELAYRARYLLDLLDPLLGHFQIVKIQLGDPPRIVSTGYTSGKIRDELTLKTHELSPSSGSGTLFEYSILFSAHRDRGLEILVHRLLRRYSRVQLSSPLRERAAISLLARTEECHYQEFGVRIERERQRYLTLMRVRYGRASELNDVELQTEPENLLRAIVEELLTQAESRVSATRASAIEILSYLVPGLRSGGRLTDERLGATTTRVFTAAKAIPALRPLAVIGMDQPEELRALVSSGPDGISSSVLPPARLRAAARLLELGDSTPLPFLLDRLTQDNPEHLHYTMAGVADFVDAQALSASGDVLTESTRARLIEATFSDEFFSHAVWQNRETEYFVDRVGSLLDPAVAEEAARLRQALSGLEGLVTGDAGSVRVRFPVCRVIWRRLAARLTPRPSERSLLFRVLPSMAGSANDPQSLQAVGEALEESPLTQPEFDTLLRALAKHQREDLSVAARFLVQVMRSIQWKEGQLRPLVAAAVAVAKQLKATSPRAHLTLLRPIADRLGLFTGVVTNRMSPDITRWESWLEDDAAVHARELKLLALQRKPELTGPPLRLIEFDLLVKRASTSVTPGTAPSEFDLLDGRVVELREGESFSFVDRWGNTVNRRLREVKNVFRTSSLRSRSRVQRPRRYRFDNSHEQLTLGIPSVGMMSDRNVRSAWVETSAFFLGSRSLTSRSASSYRTITLLTEPTDAAPPAAGDVAALWNWFVKTSLLDQSDEASLTQVIAITRILRLLRIEGAGDALLKFFDRQPTHQLARDLYTLFGERKGIEYYLNLLPRLTGSQRLAAARLLAEVGEVEGVDALLKDGSRSSLIALDRFLQGDAGTPELRERVLDHLVERLKFETVRDETDVKIIFSALEREANDDFGFTTAIGTNDDSEKMVRIRKAIEDARAWRRKALSKPSGSATESR